MPRAKNQTIDLRKEHSNGRDKWGERIADSKKGAVSWADAGAEDLLDALVAATEDGAALLLSRTSDGGALAIHVLAGSNTHKLYPASVAELNEALQMIAEIARSA